MKELLQLIYILIAGICLGMTTKELQLAEKIKNIAKSYKLAQETKEKLPEKCPRCSGNIKEIPAGVSKRTNQPYKEFWVCENPECSFTCNKRGRRFICSWDKPQKSKGRENNNIKTPKSQRSKKEEVQETDEINVEDIPF